MCFRETSHGGSKRAYTVADATTRIYDKITVIAGMLTSPLSTVGGKQMRTKIKFSKNAEKQKTRNRRNANTYCASLPYFPLLPFSALLKLLFPEMIDVNVRVHKVNIISKLLYFIGKYKTSRY